MFSYKEQDPNDKMIMEAVFARGNNIYDLVFVDNVGRFQMPALNHMLNSAVFGVVFIISFVFFMLACFTFLLQS